MTNKKKKNKEPWGIDMCEDMHPIEGAEWYNKIPTPCKMKGIIARLWTVTDCNFKHESNKKSPSYPSLQNIIKCLEWAKKELEGKYSNVHLDGIDTEVDEWGHCELQLYVVGERNETNEEFRKREIRYWSERRIKMQRDENAKKYWVSPNGVREKKEIQKMSEKYGLK